MQRGQPTHALMSCGMASDPVCRDFIFLSLSQHRLQAFCCSCLCCLACLACLHVTFPI